MLGNATASLHLHGQNKLKISLDLLLKNQVRQITVRIKNSFRYIRKCLIYFVHKYREIGKFLNAITSVVVTSTKIVLSSSFLAQKISSFHKKKKQEIRKQDSKLTKIFNLTDNYIFRLHSQLCCDIVQYGNYGCNEVSNNVLTSFNFD